jgi:hypothetical protein
VNTRRPNRNARRRPTSPGTDLIVQHVWTLVVENLARRLARARPEDLSVARTVSGERTRVTAELNVEHGAVLMSLLGVLRSGSLDDTAARRSAIDLAASALVELRASGRNERAAGEEPADGAFARLRDELRPIARYSRASLAFASPDDSRLLPAQIVNAGWAVARGAVLAMLEQDGVTRIRVGWRVADDLIVTVHDDGPGRIADQSLPMLELTAQAEAVDGAVELESVPDWGTRLEARLPLAVAAPAGEDPLDGLQPRERQVLELLAAGVRNRDIAAALHISENTAKVPRQQHPAQARGHLTRAGGGDRARSRDTRRGGPDRRRVRAPARSDDPAVQVVRTTRTGGGRRAGRVRGSSDGLHRRDIAERGG